jgi:metal-responsive CopG/Arc/MetJ family transcriptional regulator
MNDILDKGFLKAKKNGVKKSTFTLPKYLIAELDEYCKEKVIYKSRFVAHIIEQAIKDK